MKHLLLRAWLPGLVALLAALPLPAQNLLQLSNGTIAPGSTFSTIVRLTNQNPISGFTTVITYDNTKFSVTAIGVTGLDIVSAVGPIAAPGGNGGIEFWVTNIQNGAGYATASAIFDLNPPFQSQKLAAGGPRSITRYDFTAVNNPGLVGTSASIQMTNGVGSPPLNNVISESGISVFPQLSHATIDFVDLPTFKRGDSNGDGLANVADAIFVINFLFQSGAAPICEAAADINNDGLLDISDIIYNVQWQFSGGPNPVQPFPGCGVDPTPDNSCLLYPGC